MMSEWTPPPKGAEELKRRIATDPVNVTLTYQAGRPPRVVVAMGHDGTVFVASASAGEGYRDTASRLAAVLDLFEVAIRHAARELREGVTPCE